MPSTFYKQGDELKKTIYYSQLSKAYSNRMLLILVANFSCSGESIFLHSEACLMCICTDEGRKVTGPTTEACFSCHFCLLWLILLSHRHSHMLFESLYSPPFISTINKCNLAQQASKKWGCAKCSRENNHVTLQSFKSTKSFDNGKKEFKLSLKGQQHKCHFMQAF